MYEYKAKLLRIVDADTVEVLIDLGFHVASTQTVRIDGIDAPERNTPAGKLANAFLASLFTPGATCVTRTIKAPATEKFGRYLAELIVTSKEHPEGLNISAAMIAAGHAVEYHGGKRL